MSPFQQPLLIMHHSMWIARVPTPAGRPRGFWHLEISSVKVSTLICIIRALYFLSESLGCLCPPPGDSHWLVHTILPIKWLFISYSTSSELTAGVSTVCSVAFSAFFLYSSHFFSRLSIFFFSRLHSAPFSAIANTSFLIRICKIFNSYTHKKLILLLNRYQQAQSWVQRAFYNGHCNVVKSAEILETERVNVIMLKLFMY